MHNGCSGFGAMAVPERPNLHPHEVTHSALAWPGGPLKTTCRLPCPFQGDDTSSRTSSGASRFCPSVSASELEGEEEEEDPEELESTSGGAAGPALCANASVMASLTSSSKDARQFPRYPGTCARSSSSTSPAVGCGCAPAAPRRVAATTSGKVGDIAADLALAAAAEIVASRM